MHVRRSTGEPFYVGKGAGKRAWFSKTGRTKHWNNVASKNGVNVVIYKDGLLSDEALRIEVELIRELRESGVSLVNKTDGGEGVSGYKPTQEVRDKISATRNKIPIYCSNGMRFDSSGDGKRWLESIGVDCDPSGIRLCAKGIMKSYKGYAWSYDSVPEHPEFTGKDAIANGRMSQKRVTYCSNGMEFSSRIDAGAWINPENPVAASDSISAAIRSGSGVAYSLGWSDDKDNIPAPYDTRAAQIANIEPRYKKLMCNDCDLVFENVYKALDFVGIEPTRNSKDKIRSSARSESLKAYGKKWRYVQ